MENENKTPSGTWRLIPLMSVSGKLNMAIDSWLLEQHRLGHQPPCLRFYTWSPPAISLGYHQKRVPDHWSSLTWKNQPIDLIRRPTGGRAVLHQGDLTYAVITSGLEGNRMQVYRQLCQFLIAGWQTFGVTLQFGDSARGYIHNPNCFGTATAADLVMPGGYKLIGSAQVYKEGCILQHGSIRLTPDPALFESVFGDPLGTVQWPPALQKPQAHQIQQIIDVLCTAVKQVFAVDLELQPLSDQELETIKSMATEGSVKANNAATPKQRRSSP